ncbi:hypothetical protein ACOMHN_013520 [Nucella lapillus]
MDADDDVCLVKVTSVKPKTQKKSLWVTSSFDDFGSFTPSSSRTSSSSCRPAKARPSSQSCSSQSQGSSSSSSSSRMVQKTLSTSFSQSQDKPSALSSWPVSRKRQRELGMPAHKLVSALKSSRYGKQLKPAMNYDLWSDKHQPKKKDDLAVHKKKVQDITCWLRDRTKGCPQRWAPVLVLTGPPGSGKTAVVRTVAEDLGLAVQEWTNPSAPGGDSQADQADWAERSSVDVFCSQSQSSQFSHFLLRANKYRALQLGPDPSAPTDSRQGRLILVEVDGELGHKVDGELGHKVDGELGHKVDGELGRKVDGELGHKVDGELGHKVDGELGHKVDGELGHKVDGELGHKVDGELGHKVDGELGHKVDGELGHKVDGELGRKVDGELGHRVDGKLGHKVNGELGHKVDGKLGHKVDGELGHKVDGELGHKVDGELGHKVDGELGHKVDGELGHKVNGELGHKVDGELGHKVDGELGHKVDGKLRHKVDGELGRKDIPNAFYRDPTELHNIVRQYARHGHCPLMFVVSEASSSSSSVQRLFPPGLQAELGLHTISVNPVAPTMMVKVLNKIANLEAAQGGFAVPGARVVEAIAMSSAGDVRSAINALQFACRHDTGDLGRRGATSGVKKAKSGSGRGLKYAGVARQDSGSAPPLTQAALGAKDTACFLFHALGKILHFKRGDPADSPHHPALPPHLSHHDRDPLLLTPEEVVEKTHLSGDYFNTFLHQNYLDFVLSVEDLDRASEYLSDADMLCAQYTSRGQLQDYSTSVATRGLIHAQSSLHYHADPRPGHGWRPMHKSQWFAAIRQSQDRKATAMQLFRGYHWEPEVLLTELVPYINLINPTLHDPGQFAFVQNLCQYSRSSNVLRSGLERLEEKGALEEEEEDPQPAACPPGDPQPHTSLPSTVHTADHLSDQDHLPSSQSTVKTAPMEAEDDDIVIEEFDD